MKTHGLMFVIAALVLAGSAPARAFVCPPVMPTVSLQCDNVDPATYDAAQKELDLRAQSYLKAVASRPKLAAGGLNEAAIKKATTPLGQSMEAALFDMLKDLRERGRTWSWAPANQTPAQRKHQNCMFRLLFAVDKELNGLKSYVDELDAREAKVAASKDPEAEARAAIYAPEMQIIHSLLTELAASSDPLEKNTAKIMMENPKLWKVILKKGGAKGQYKNGVLSINPTAVFHKPSLRAVLVHEIGHHVTEVAGYTDPYVDEFHGYWREFSLTQGKAATPAEIAARSTEIHEVLRCLYRDLPASDFAAPYLPFLHNELAPAKLRGLSKPIEPPGGKARLKGQDLTDAIAALPKADKKWAIKTLTDRDATWSLLNDALADELLTRLGAAIRPKANPYDAILDRAEAVVAGPR